MQRIPFSAALTAGIAAALCLPERGAWQLWAAMLLLSAAILAAAYLIWLRTLRLPEPPPLQSSAPGVNNLRRWISLCVFPRFCLFPLSVGADARARQTAAFSCFQAALACFALLAGAAYALWRTENALAQQWPVELYPQAQTLRVRITGLPERDEAGRTRFIGTAVTAAGQSYRLLFQDYAPRQWHTGENWELSARVRAPLGTRNPSGFDREAWALANSIDGIASVGRQRRRLPETVQNNGSGALRQAAEHAAVWIEQRRADISQRWLQDGAAYPQGAGLMRALTVADRSGMSSELWAALRPLGLNHLISISGLHIGMVAWLAAYLAGRLLRLLPWLPRRPYAWQAAIGLAAASVYAALAGFDVPTVRSVLMLAVFAAAWLWRGRQNGWQAWRWALLAVLLYQPASLLAAGTWLSFGLVGALLWVGSARPVFRQHAEPGWRRALRAQWSATLLGAVATARFFSTVPLFGPAVNAFAIPLFTWLLVPAALAASVLPFAWLRQTVAAAGQYTVEVLLWLGTRLPEWQAAQTPWYLTAAAIAAALLILLPRGLALRLPAAVILAAFFCYRPPPPDSGSLRVSVADVGQGLGVLLQTQRHTLLFDSAPPAAPQNLLPLLRANAVGRLDTLVLSHHDTDHDGGYPALQREHEIAHLWAGQPQFYRNAYYCAHGTRWQWDGVWFEFLTPPSKSGRDDNEQSCVLRVLAGGQAVMITGDLGRSGEQWLVGQYGFALHSQLLVLGHHGSRSASSNVFINAVSPQIAVASSGFANPFKHPHPDVVNTLNANRVRLMRTDTQGALVFTLSAQGLHAQVWDREAAWWRRKPFLPAQYPSAPQ